MRLLFALMLSGFLFLTLNGCSEKQKEADRMEQEVQDQEAESDTMSAAQGTIEPGQPSSETAAVILEGGLEPSPADPSVVPPESAPASSAARPTEAQPRPEATKPAMPPAPTGVGYTVQIASCESEDYARHLVAVYTKRGYEPFVATISYNNLVYYRVRIGHYPTVAAAKTLKDELTDRFSIKPWVDRTE